MEPPLQWRARVSIHQPPLQTEQQVRLVLRAAPTNGPVFIAPICRGGSITSRPYKCPPYKTDAAPSFSLGHSLQPVKERWGGLGHLPKIALLRGKVLISNPLVERL